MSETTPVTIEVTIKGAIAQFNQIVPKEMAALAVEEYIKAEVAKVENLVIADMHDKEGYEKVKRARLDLGRGIRVPIEKKGKELRADANAYQKAVIAEENRLVEIVTPAEKKLKQMEDEYERLWEEKRLKDEAEKKAKINSRIQALTELGMRFDAATSFYYLPEGAATIGMGHIETWEDDQFSDFTTKVAADIERKRKADEAEAEALQRFNERKAALIERGYKINEAKNEIADADDIIGLAWLETTDDITFNGLLDNIDAVIANRKELEAAEQKRKDDELAEARKQVEAAKEEIRASRQMVINQLSDVEKALVEKRTFIGKSLINDLDDFSAADFTEFIALIKEEAAWPVQAVPVHEDDARNVEIYNEVDASLRQYPLTTDEAFQQEDEPQAEYSEPVFVPITEQRMRVSGGGTCIVVDKPYLPGLRQSGHADTQYYGGYLVCESIPTAVAELVCQAWNEKYFPNK